MRRRAGRVQSKRLHYGGSITRLCCWVNISFLVLTTVLHESTCARMLGFYRPPPNTFSAAQSLCLKYQDVLLLHTQASFFSCSPGDSDPQSSLCSIVRTQTKVVALCFHFARLARRCNRFNSITLQAHGMWYTMGCDATVYPGAAHSVRSGCGTCCKSEGGKLESIWPALPFAGNSPVRFPSASSCQSQTLVLVLPYDRSAVPHQPMSPASREPASSLNIVFIPAGGTVYRL